MAKSTGNNILPNEIFTGDNPNLEKGFAPTIARFFMLQAHYRSILDFSNEALLASEKGFNRLMDAYHLLNELKTSETSSYDVAAWRQKCYDAMNDDFNSPILIAQLFEAVKQINVINEGKAEVTKDDLELLRKSMRDFLFEVLGLVDTAEAADDDAGNKLTGTVELLIKLRAEARANKDFATSDKIRDELLDLGIQLKDGKDGTSFSLN